MTRADDTSAQTVSEAALDNYATACFIDLLRELPLLQILGLLITLRWCGKGMADRVKKAALR